MQINRKIEYVIMKVKTNSLIIIEKSGFDEAMLKARIVKRI